MKRIIFPLGITGAALYTIRLLGESSLFLQRFLFDITSIRFSDGSVDTALSRPAENFFIYLFYALIFAACILFIGMLFRILLRFRKGKPIKKAVIITLTLFSVFNILTLIPSQITVIPRYLLMRRLQLLNTGLALYGPIVFSLLTMACLVVSLILMLMVLKKESVKALSAHTDTW